jgi:hypothetical protein
VYGQDPDPEVMTTTHLPVTPLTDRRRDSDDEGLEATSAQVVPITRGSGDRVRTIGVVLLDARGARWQPTLDLERLLAVAAAAAGLVAATGFISSALRQPGARVDRITMGPGGWVSFKGGRKPQPRGPRRPWWAVLLQARPLDS